MGLKARSQSLKQPKTRSFVQFYFCILRNQPIRRARSQIIAKKAISKQMITLI